MSAVAGKARRAGAAARLLGTGGWIDRLRLWSGLILFAFVLTHFLNHALGLVSLSAMEQAQHGRLLVTRSLPGSLVLRLALATHALIALRTLARLRTARMPWLRALQAGLGFLIPLLLMGHLFKAGIRSGALADAATYPGVLADIWPDGFAWQTALLLVVWTHACLGLHYWLRGEAWYRRASHGLAALAALIPAAALAGAAEAAREIIAAGIVAPAAMREEWSAAAHRAIFVAYALVFLVIAYLALRFALRRRSAAFAIAYDSGAVIRTSAGPTLLDISRAHRIPHLSVCGGKARCSTCRVRVVAGVGSLAPPNEAEKRLLRRIGAPPDVRLACQIHPAGPLTVARLLNPEAGARTVDPNEAAGVIREAAVLFVDIRGFTRLSETKLAFDVVFILNSFFTAAARAIEAHGGRIDKYMGDGVMAVFESGDSVGAASRAALVAVVALDGELAAMNARLGDEIREPLRLGMGLHAGRVVLGRIGWGPAASPTVIGRVVNLASRLESLAKARDALLAVSKECVEFAGLPLDACGVEEVDVRGLDAPFPVVLVMNAVPLADALSALERQPQVS